MINQNTPARIGRAMLAMAGCILLVAGCGGPGGTPPAEAPDSPEDEAASQDPSRLAVPANVRANLGITFAKVERRTVRETLRVPGQFELRPEARRDYHAMLAGRVQLLVKQYDLVVAGTPLLRLDSPEWRRLQLEISEAESGILLAEVTLEVERATAEETRGAATLLEQRVADLAEASVRKIDLETELAKLKNSLRRQGAEIKAKEVAVEAARNRHAVIHVVAASVTGLTSEALHESVETAAGPMPRWEATQFLEQRAESAGIVDTLSVTPGGWAETGDELLTTADPKLIRFSARAFQGDMGRLSAGLDAQVVPPQGGSIDLQDTIAGSLLLGFLGEPDQRTLPIYVAPENPPAWARPGVTGFLEVFVGGGTEGELAVPRSCVIRDGLHDVFFRRNPADPDEVIRVEAELGTGDGRWVVLKSGVKEGDEVVLDGAYELKLASSASAATAGHFHADGTFHSGEDE